MHIAAIFNKVYIAYYASNKGVSVDSRDNNGHTPIHWAVYRNSMDVMRLLHRLGADINVPDTYGRTPLHWAANGRNQRIVRTLLSWGAKANLKDDGGYTPDVIAQTKGHKNSAILLKKAIDTPFNAKALYKYGQFWTMGAVCAYAMVCFMIAYFPLWLNALIIPFALFFVRRKYSIMFPYSVVNCKVWASFFVMTWLVGSLYMNTKLIPALKSHLFLSIVAVILDIATIVVYIRLVKANPGRIEPQPLLQEELERMVMANEFLGDFCPSCLMIRPARSKHCETCDACVARFDHHCVWVDGCVGYLNNLKFMIYLVVLIMLQIMYLILSMIYFVGIIKPLVGGGASLFGIIGAVWDDSSLGVAFCALFLLQIVWESLLLYQQCQNVAYNTSINERKNWPKYPLMKDPKTGKRVYPFKLPTLKENVEEFVKGGRNWFKFRWVDLLPPEVAAKQTDVYHLKVNEV